MEDVDVGWGVTIPAAELRWRFSRSSGPGGQHVNTSDTRAELRWDLAASAALTAEQKERLRQVLAARLTDHGELLVVADSQRSQTRNRQAAVERFAELLRQGLRPRRRRRATVPTRQARERRLQAKRRRAERKTLRRRPEPDA